MLLVPIMLLAHNEAQSSYVFVENKGQWDSNALFRVDLNMGALFLEKNAFTYSFKDYSEIVESHSKKVIPENLTINGHAYKVLFEGAAQTAMVVPNHKRKSYSNYFLGNDKEKWVGGAREFEGVDILGIYHDVDLKMYSRNGLLKYDLVVRKGGNSDNIKLRYDGVEDLEITKSGSLLVRTSINETLEEKPYAYQVVRGRKVEVQCNYVLKENELTFDFPKGYNENFDLVIDPTLMFSTYTGSVANNFGYTATFDNLGYLYSGSTTFSQTYEYPTTLGAFQESYGGGGVDIGLTKFDTTGTFMVWSSYLGGAASEMPHSLIVDSKNDLYVLCTTGSSDFPTFSNAFDTVFHGGTSVNLGGLGVAYNSGCDFAIAKIKEDGTQIMSSTYVGGAGNDGINTAGALRYNYADEVRGEIIVDRFDDLYVASCTQSNDFPIIGNNLQDSLRGVQDGCLFKINNDLSEIEWSTYFGGDTADALFSVSLDENQDVYVAGGTNSGNFPVTSNALDTTYNGGRSDGVLAHIKQDGTQVINSTYVGSSEYDQIYFVKLDRDFQVHVYGQTEVQDSTFIYNADYAVPKSGQFIVKYNPTIDSMIWSTVFGSGLGNPDISPTAFMVDLCNKVYLSGWGGGPNTNAGLVNNNANTTNGLPVTWDALQSNTNGSDFYLMVLEDDASDLVYASYFGGSGSEHVDGGTSRFDRKGKIYHSVCASCGGWQDFPTTPGAVSNSNNGTSNNSNVGCNNAVFKVDFNLPMIAADLDYERPFEGCVPFEIDFVNLSLSQGATQYWWDFGDGSSLDSSTVPTHTYQDTGHFFITLYAHDTLSCNLRDTAYLPLYVFQRPEVIAEFVIEDTVVCDSLTVDIVNNSVGQELIYEWTFGIQDTSFEETPDPYVFHDPGFHIIKLIAQDTICNVPDTTFQVVQFSYEAPYELDFDAESELLCNSVSISVTNQSTGIPLEFTWDFGNGIMVMDENSAQTTFDIQPQYEIDLIAFEPECQLNDTVTKTVFFNFEVPVTADFSLQEELICNVLNITTTDNSEGEDLSFEWFLDGDNYALDSISKLIVSDTGDYQISLIVTEGECGYKDTSYYSLSFKDQPYEVISDFQIEQNDYCKFDLHVENNSVGNNLQFTWEIDDEMYFTETVDLVFSNPLEKEISLTVVDTECNFKSTKDTVVPMFGILVSSEIFAPEYICEFDSIELKSVNENKDEYKWSTGDSTVKTVAYKSGYYVLMERDSICWSYDTVYVKPAPIQTKLTDTQEICADFYSEIGPKTDETFSYKWFNGDTTKTIKVLETGAYGFEFTDMYDCVNQDTIYTVDSTLFDNIWIPNSFTPNNDGINEEFRVALDHYDDFKFSIFNRWGQEIFQTNDPAQGWDGRFKSDKTVPTGVYVWKVEYKHSCSQNKTLEEVGTVTLIR